MINIEPADLWSSELFSLKMLGDPKYVIKSTCGSIVGVSDGSTILVADDTSSALNTIIMPEGVLTVDRQTIDKQLGQTCGEAEYLAMPIVENLFYIMNDSHPYLIQMHGRTFRKDAIKVALAWLCREDGLCVIHNFVDQKYILVSRGRKKVYMACYKTTKPPGGVIPLRS